MSRKRRNIFEDNPVVASDEQDTPRGTWEAIQGKVHPSIVNIGKGGLGKAKHPHWRNSGKQRSRLDRIASTSHKHLEAKP